MQAILLFLAVSAAIGVRGHRSNTTIPASLLLGMSIILAVALYSRRIL